MVLEWKIDVILFTVLFRFDWMRKAVDELLLRIADFLPIGMMKANGSLMNSIHILQMLPDPHPKL